MSQSTAERKNGGFAGSGRWARIAIRYVGLILGPVLGLACFAASAQAEILDNQLFRDPLYYSGRRSSRSTSRNSSSRIEICKTFQPAASARTLRT